MLLHAHAPARPRLLVTLAAVAATLVATLNPVAAVPAAAAPFPWDDPSLSPDRRAALVLAEMTLEEKVDLMTGDQGEAPSAFYNAPIPRLGIPELRMADATSGIAARGWTLPETGETATAMPSMGALAATWDPAVSRRFAGVVAEEARATGHEMLLGPNSDPSRQPFWGRFAESAGEDPELNSDIVVPFVRRVQRENVIANLKHYTAYTQEVNRGLGQNSIVSERALREVHTRAYEDAIARADLGSVMCSFNKINGVYACESDEALDTILREQLGFTGFVITDFGAIHSTEPSIRAGTDMETGSDTFYDGALLTAVRNGQVPESLVDRSVLRILRTMFAVGVFDNDYTPTELDVVRHGRVAAAVQRRAITLLQNRGSALPLTGLRSSGGRRSIAVIGADATTTSSLGGSALVQPTYRVPLLDAVRARAGARGIAVAYARGNDPVHPAGMIESADMTAVPSSVLSLPSGTGRGLRAEYFASPDLSGTPGLVRTERQVLYDVGFTGGSPAFANLYDSQVPATPVLGANPTGGNESVRYTGRLTPPTDGRYRLGLTGWGDARVWLDGDLVVDMTGRDGRRDERSATLSLEGGRAYTLRVEYRATRPLVGLQPGTLVLQWSTPDGAYSPSIRRAARVAARSSAAVVYVRTYETEERDRVSLKLPQSADQLIRAVRAANPRTVVVTATGGPVTMPWAGQVPAVLQNYFGGQEEGSALASVLLGVTAPSGRLPMTFPRSESELPPGIDNPWDTADDLDVRFSEGVNVGYRGYLASGTRPLFPFGHGLTYTTFRYAGLRTTGLDARGPRDTARVSVRVTNTGRRTAREVVQVYLGRLPGLAAPARKLAGFTTVTLDPGTTRTVQVEVPRRTFSAWDADDDVWRTPRGRVSVLVGRSSTDVRLTGIVTVR